MPNATFRDLLVELEQRIRDDANREGWSAQYFRDQIEALRKIREIMQRSRFLDEETTRAL